MIKDLKFVDKIIILWTTGLKTLRGFRKRIFLKKSKGLFLVGKKVKISHSSYISCGKRVKFEDYSEIQGLSTDGIIIGDNVTIGRGVMIRPSSYYGIDKGRGLKIGNNSSIGPYSYVGCAGKITIGNNVMIGPKCSIFAENHNFQDSKIPIKKQGVNQKGISIKDNCWIGGNVTILDGVTIEEGCVIGANTIVTKDLEANTLLINKRENYKKKRS